MHEIKACFCQIPFDVLVDMVKDKYVFGLSTDMLLTKYSSDRHRSYLIAVALFDVPGKTLRVIMQDPESLNHVLACRKEIASLLRDRGIEIRLPEETVSDKAAF